MLSDLRNHSKEPKRGNLIALPDMIGIMASYESLGVDFFASHTYSTTLNESKLIEKYGQPDEIAEDYLGGLGLQPRESSKMLRYGWLRILVKPDGEIWAVKRKFDKKPNAGTNKGDSPGKPSMKSASN